MVNANVHLKLSCLNYKMSQQSGSMVQVDLSSSRPEDEWKINASSKRKEGETGGKSHGLKGYAHAFPPYFLSWEHCGATPTPHNRDDRDSSQDRRVTLDVREDRTDRLLWGQAGGRLESLHYLCLFGTHLFLPRSCQEINPGHKSKS